MTDKQIMIDGVDVSGCKCFYINDSHPERQECINPYCKGFCKDNPNCYYKQLQRKEQECERLKLQLAHSCHDVLYKNSLQGQLDQLKADYKQLEITCEDFKKCINKQRNAKIQLSKLKEKQYKEFCDMKQTLVEIKEIVEKEIVCDDCNLQGTDKCDSRLCTSFYLDDFCKSLLQKISEVKE